MERSSGRVEWYKGEECEGRMVARSGGECDDRNV